MMEKTLEKSQVPERPNPYNPGRFYEDHKDTEARRGNVWEQRGGVAAGEERVLVLRMQRRDAANQFEEHVRSLVRASDDKPRWRKIVEHANSLADETGVSREEFYATALIEYIEKRENERIGRELNEAYGRINQDDDLARLNTLVSHYDPQLADE